MVNYKILPYFKNKRMNDITVRDVIKWQNELRSMRDEKGNPYKGTYLKTLNAQLSAIFNHAVRFYKLNSNPVRQAGTIGSHDTEKMLFWTKDEYLTFIPEVADKPYSIYGIKKNDRIFTITKSYLHHEMDRGVKASGVKRIRIHDLRHSHVSLLINMGFSAVAIGNRVGHESEKITYRYAHMFPTVQSEMAEKLDEKWEEGFDVSESV